MKFCKYHALGNDYVVLEPAERGTPPTAAQIRAMCDRNYGIGADGILLRAADTPECDVALRIFNPDGSEAEKSGNGLRIFARYLWDRGLVTIQPFAVLTAGGKVRCRVHDDGRCVTVDMGEVSFDSRRIPVAGPDREVIDETMTVDRRRLRYCAATVGNPHCVILRDDPTPEETRRLGPLVETDDRFPNRTNVQFMKILDRSNIQIEIWERGAGYTLASGSSSCASAAVAYRLGLCNPQVAVHMPGDRLDITISDDFTVSMTGPVTKICEGVLSAEMFEATPARTA